MDKIGQVPDRYLSDEQRLMRQTCRRYVDEVVRPFIAANREREWLFDPDQRLPAELRAELPLPVLEELARQSIAALGGISSAVPSENDLISFRNSTSRSSVRPERVSTAMPTI